MNTANVRAAPMLLLLVAAGAVACGQQTAPGAGATVSPHPHPAAAATASFRISPVATITFSALSPPAPSPRTTQTPAGHVTVTAASSGTTIAMRIGQVITVNLGSSRGVTSYHQPHASGTALRRLWARGGYPARTPATAGFRATHAGTSELTSITDASCLHTRPRCTFPQLSWRVSVIVR
jgi:hypothetical protein